MSNDIVQKLGEIKQYQSKLPKTIISKVSSKVFEILGGVNPILDHYLSNARYLKVNQIKELHKLLQQTKREFYKKQLKKKQVRHAASSSNGANNLLSQSYTPLATTPPGYAFDNDNKTQRLRPQRKRARTAGKSPKQRQYKNKPQYNAVEITPIFLSKSADFEPPQPHKRKGSGLEQRMRFEFTKNKPKSPIANHIVSLSAISNVSVPRSMTDAEFLNITNINLTSMNTQNRAIVTKRDMDPEDSVKTTIEHEMDEVRPQNIMIDDGADDEFGRIRMQSGSGISTINIEKFTPIQPIFYDDKKRRYSISEQSDWDTDDDAMETKKSHEYFDKLANKYGKKKKGKNRKKRRKKKTRKLKRMAMEQMKKEKNVKEKQSMSALDALVSVLDEESDDSENRKHGNDMEMNGDYDKRGNAEFEEGQDTKAKVDDVKQGNVKPSIDSAEFKEYFERFMQENSSFYAYKLEHMDGAENVDLECDDGDDSDVSSMEYEDYQHQFQ